MIVVDLLVRDLVEAVGDPDRVGPVLDRDEQQGVVGAERVAFGGLGRELGARAGRPSSATNTTHNWTLSVSSDAVDRLSICGLVLEDAGLVRDRPARSAGMSRGSDRRWRAQERRATSGERDEAPARMTR